MKLRAAERSYIIIFFACNEGDHEKCPGHYGEKFYRCDCHCHASVRWTPQDTSTTGKSEWPPK